MPSMYRKNPDTGAVEERYFPLTGIAGAYLSGWSRVRPGPSPGASTPPTSFPQGGAFGATVTMYRTADNGEVERVAFPRAQAGNAIAQGYTPYPPVSVPSLTIGAGGMATGVAGRQSTLLEAVGLYWLDYLNRQSKLPPFQYRIISVKPAATSSPSGNPRFLVTWGYQGATQGASPLWQGPTMESPLSTGRTWAPGVQTTDEVSLVPDEGKPGSFSVVASSHEPGFQLPDLAESLLSGEETPENVLANDRRVASIFANMRDGKTSRALGYWQLSQLVGTQAAKLLDNTAWTMVEAMQGIVPGTLPRFNEETPINLLFGGPEALRGTEDTRGRTEADLWNQLVPGINYQDVALDPRLVAPPAQGPLNDIGLPDTGENYFLSMALRGGRDYAMPPAPALTPEQMLAQAFAQAMAGFGGGGPSYQAPDRNLVRDNVKAMLVALTGSTNSGRVEMLTDIYMSEHRNQFGGAAVDPGQAVKDKIRTFDDYKRIHALRPEFVDEMDWLAYQNQGLMQGGMRNSAVERRAITQAMVGTAPARAEQAGYLSEFSETGRANMPGFFDRLRDMLTALGGAVK